MLDQRLEYRPAFPNFTFKSFSNQKNIDPEIQKLFPNLSSQKEVTNSRKGPLKIGALFSGGQAPGGHNVLVALFESNQSLIGFLNGPKGLINGDFRELCEEEINSARNTGGFDLIGSGRDKIETEEQKEKCLKTCQKLGLDGLVIIGGDDSNTNAAHLAEYFLEKGLKTSVIGVPKTIDGDLQTKNIQISFGFDSAAKTYSEMIGNLAKDALSAKKYYHFVKLMGRSASHITLECALKTQPNLALIGEERKSLSYIIEDITNLISERSEKGKDYGIILIPEGLIEFTPGFEDLNLERDSHGNIKLSQIETEKLLIEKVKEELSKRDSYKGTFSPVSHFFGYEGRSCYPSNFDASYCYALGKIGHLAIKEAKTGVIVGVKNLAEPTSNWEAILEPTVSLLHMEERKGKLIPVIAKTLVDLKSRPFQRYASLREKHRLLDAYLIPGPMQFFGPSEITDSVPEILK